MRPAILLTLLAVLPLQAAPYIVYSGTTGEMTDTSDSATSRYEEEIYLVTDVADTSNFALLEAQGKNYVWNITEVPSSSQSTGEFLGAVMKTSGGGTAVLACHPEQVDASFTTVTDFYGTGPLVTANTVLVPARTKAVTVAGVTFPAATAETSGGVPFVSTLKGTFRRFVLGSSALSEATTSTTFTLTRNEQLTVAANVGGPVGLGRAAFAMVPISDYDGPGAAPADVYYAWLHQLGLGYGYINPIGGSGGSGITVASAGSVSLGSSISGSGSFSGVTVTSGVVSVGTGTGIVEPDATLTLGGETYQGDVNLSGDTLIFNLAGGSDGATGLTSGLTDATFTDVITLTMDNDSNGGGSSMTYTLVPSGMGTLTLSTGTLSGGTQSTGTMTGASQ